MGKCKVWGAKCMILGQSVRFWGLSVYFQILIVERILYFQTTEICHFYRFCGTGFFVFQNFLLPISKSSSQNTFLSNTSKITSLLLHKNIYTNTTSQRKYHRESKYPSYTQPPKPYTQPPKPYTCIHLGGQPAGPSSPKYSPNSPLSAIASNSCNRWLLLN